VELIRNLPLLFQILFWYLAVLGTLPGPRQSLSIWEAIFLNNRGLIVPAPVVGGGGRIRPCCFGIRRSCRGVALEWWSKHRQDRTGRQFPTLWSSLGLIIGLPLIAAWAVGWPISFERPRVARLQFRGRHSPHPRVHGAFACALALYRGVHCRDRACRHRCDPARTNGGALALGLPRSLMLRLSSCRKPCALSCRRSPTSTSISPRIPRSLSRSDIPICSPFCGNRAQSDRPGDRDHRHHHGPSIFSCRSSPALS